MKNRRPVISRGIVNSLIETGSIDPFGMALDIRLGMLHGSVGIGVTNKMAGINYFTYDRQSGIMEEMGSVGIRQQSPTEDTGGN